MLKRTIMGQKFSHYSWYSQYLEGKKRPDVQLYSLKGAG